MELEKFCFCCKLRKGVFIWGIFSVIVCLIVFLTNVSSDFFVKRVSTEHASLVYWLVFVISIVYLMSSVLLCAGVLKKNHYIVLPYVIITGVFLIPVGFTALLGLLAAIPILCPIYIWLCICTYYLKIRDDRILDFQLVVYEAN